MSISTYIMADSQLINERLKKLGVQSIENPRIEAYLSKIQDVADEINEQRSAALEQLRRSKITALTISKRTGIARQTLYNNPVLKLYIDSLIQDFKETTASEEIAKLKIQLMEKDEIIQKMVGRDAELVVCREKISALEDQVRLLQRQQEPAQSVAHQRIK